MPDNEPTRDNFNELLAAVRACLPLDELTRVAVELLDDQYRNRIEAIILSPFPAAERRLLLDKAREEYLEQLEALCDTEHDLN